MKKLIESKNQEINEYRDELQAILHEMDSVKGNTVRSKRSIKSWKQLTFS